MKKILLFICVNWWTVFLIVSINAQDFKTVQDGIEYAEMTRGTKEEPIHINLLKIDLTKVRLDVVHAKDAAIGVEKTSSIATRYGAFAAINAGFFRLDNSLYGGDAAGVLMIDGKLLSESYGNRNAIGILNKTNQTTIEFGHLSSKSTLLAGIDSQFEINGINRQRGKNEIIIYTPEFHRTTLTDSDGTEIIVKNKSVVEIRKNKGSSIIPPDGFIISINGEQQKQVLGILKMLKVVRISNKLNALEEPKQLFFSKAEDIVGGVPQLIKNGKIEITWEQEKSTKAFVETKHPRTAVAKLKDGKFLMATVDGRQPGYSVGMDLNELAAFLLELGATDAMNLDGGGSTTMFLDGKVMNKPSDKEGERNVSDAILVFPRKKM
jgi:exopolysaccharide biosynthesis protein